MLMIQMGSCCNDIVISLKITIFFVNVVVEINICGTRYKVLGDASAFGWLGEFVSIGWMFMDQRV